MAAQDEWRGYKEALARGDYNAVIAELRPLADAGNPEAQYRYGMTRGTSRRSTSSAACIPRGAACPKTAARR